MKSLDVAHRVILLVLFVVLYSVAMAALVS